MISKAEKIELLKIILSATADEFEAADIARQILFLSAENDNEGAKR